MRLYLYFLFQTFAVFLMLYSFFSVISRRLNFTCRRFGTHCLFHLHRQVGVKNDQHTYPHMKMEQTQCSETSAYKIQTPGNYPEESMQHVYILLATIQRNKSVIFKYGQTYLLPINPPLRKAHTKFKLGGGGVYKILANPQL